ncbi:unnamed protein product [Urochloa decumbens]|uniref:KIB1-4 beta-propeller domain-containing protein n=1 Tax=Urochloa decumbens TaxID=240449 RepID=A0ABC9G8L1_9POAL
MAKRPAAAMESSTSKRPAAAMEEGRDWASLLPELLSLVAARLLAVDVVDYISFRGACARWRASAPSPRGWVALCDGDGVRPADACAATASYCFTDGLLILINKATTAIRVLHPFTRAAVDLPPTAAIFNYMVKDEQSRAWMRAAVCASEESPDDSIAVVAWFPTVPGVVVAEPGFPCWYIVYHSVELASAVSFQGRVYGVLGREREIQQIYPRPPCKDRCVARIPNTFGIPQTNKFFLVESDARLVLVLRHFHFVNCSEEGYRPCEFTLFEVDTVERRELVPVSSLGDQAVFLSHDRCLCVSQSNLPSIANNTIYYDSEGLYPISMYSVSDGTSELLSKFSIIHDYTERIRPSVRPFTLVDQLFTFCNHRCWSRGLMFHEYHCLPRSWKALFKKLKAQDREVQVPS